jgi:dihydrofolate synthase/folylpolyglutamate synthase
MYAADARHDNPTLQDKLEHLFTLRGGPGIDLTIRPAYLDLLHRLGDPHLNLPPVIHVAGTNGKGSVVAMLRAVLGAAGYRVHAYTSPHLLRFNERITLAGQEIADELLEQLLDEVVTANDGAELTFFEITTAVAFLAFSRVKADFTLLETGLGGRLDCTNVVPDPVITAITAIGHDHNEFLGPTLAAIAGEKAGIIKAARPCIIGPIEDAEARAAIVAKALALDAPLLAAGQDWHATPLPDDAGILFEIDGLRQEWPRPNLRGDHQVANAGIVLTILRQMEKDDYLFDRTAVMEGLTQTNWPARLQKIERGALFDILPEGSQLWLDGGHNESAGVVLGKQMARWRKRDSLPVHAVVAMMQTKRAEAFLGHILPYCDTVTTTEIANESKCWPAGTLASMAGQAGAQTVQSAPNLTRALEQLAADGRPKRVLVCGSLYLAGQALALNAQKPG